MKRRVVQLATFPGSGRVVPELDDSAIRELVEAPYRIIYTVRERPRRVVILVVHHGHRQLPPVLP